MPIKRTSSRIPADTSQDPALMEVWSAGKIRGVNVDTTGIASGDGLVYDGTEFVAEAFLFRDGSVALTGDLSMGGNQLTSVGTPSAGTDAANRDYVDAHPGFWQVQSIVPVSADGTLVIRASVGSASASYDPLCLPYGVLVYNSSNAQNDELQVLDVTVPTNGDYELILRVQKWDSAIVTVYLDGVSKGTYDTYNASRLDNAYSTGFDLGTLTANTAYDLKFKAETRNGSATTWYIAINEVIIRRTA